MFVILFIGDVVLGGIFIQNVAGELKDIIEFGGGCGAEFKEDGVDEKRRRVLGVIDDIVEKERL
jgi:hypothetical protein